MDLSVDADQRCAACLALREHLKSLPEESPLRPRQRDPMRGIDLGLNPDAFLQPDVHGECALRFFERYFQEKGLVCRPVPPVGVRIVVRSRFDSDVVTPAFTVVCRSPGLPEEEKPLEFGLYNTTGEGIAGTHFYPILGSTASGGPAASSQSSAGGKLDGSSGGSPARRVRAKTSHGGQEFSSSASGSAGAEVVVVVDEEASAASSSAAPSSGTGAAAVGSAAVLPAGTQSDTAPAVRRSARVATRAGAAAAAAAAAGGQASRPKAPAKARRMSGARSGAG